MGGAKSTVASPAAAPAIQTAEGKFRPNLCQAEFTDKRRIEEPFATNRLTVSRFFVGHER